MARSVRAKVWNYGRLLSLAGLDAVDLITGRRRAMVPSRLQNDRIGGYDFQSIGKELASIVRNLGELKPSERVLDVGCGYGRVAVQLASYLETGEYCGFDIDAQAIRWCRRQISSRHPNFWFAHVDVANGYYNRGGPTTADTFTFPCADSSVDVVIATSLFTHLLPPAAARYVAEIHRVLKPGGRAVLSFFLFDDELKRRLIDTGSYPPFRHFPEPFYAVSDPDQPELGVAYDQSVVQEAFRTRGLEIRRIERGAWSESANAMSFQDFVLATRR